MWDEELRHLRIGDCKSAAPVHVCAALRQTRENRNKGLTGEKVKGTSEVVSAGSPPALVDPDT